MITLLSWEARKWREKSPRIAIKQCTISLLSSVRAAVRVCAFEYWNARNLSMLYEIIRQAC